MKVKRFFSPTMQGALKMVKEDMGSDAVILSNNKVDGGVEVVVALDYEEAFSEQGENSQSSFSGEPSPSQIAKLHADKHVHLQKEMEKARGRIESVKIRRQREKQRAESNTDTLPAGSKNSDDTVNAESLSELRSDIHYLKNLMNEQLSNGSQGGMTNHSGVGLDSGATKETLLQQKIKKSLDALSIAQSIQTPLLGSIASMDDFELAWNKIKAQINGAIQIDHSEIIDEGGVMALVGPTGSGKTMTIGKLAAQYVMKYGSESIALVTTDRYRIAAHEQLKVFGRILNVPVHTVDENYSLDCILDTLKDKKLVLVDTAGLMHSDSHWSEQLQEIKLSQHNIKSYLVLSAVGQYQVMRSTYHYYKIAGLAGCFITKLDEAVSLGEVISFLIDSGLKARYYTDGQRVPEDIHLFCADALWQRAETLLNSSERWVTIHADTESQPENSLFFYTA